MRYKFIVVPTFGGERAEQELNDFLARHRVLSVEKRWCEQGATTFYHFCISYTNNLATPFTSDRPAPPKTKVDYKAILSPQDFAVYDRLRRKRKELAEAEAVPVYSIFNNEQLANMVRHRATSKAALAKIDGIGEAKLDKYAEAVLDVLTRVWADETQPDAA